MKTICVIPARLDSSRLKQKMLLPLKGVPLMLATYQAALDTQAFDEVILAVDHEKLYAIAHKEGARVILTSPNHQSGTERLIEVANLIAQPALWVNWQGDEPFLGKEHIYPLLDHAQKNSCAIYSLKTPIHTEQEFLDPSNVKVVTDHAGKALYFSRSPIPHNGLSLAHKHLGIYAYTHSALQKVQHCKPSTLAVSERLEQLNFLAAGIPIFLHTVQKGTIGIDTMEDFKKALTLT